MSARAVWSPVLALSLAGCAASAAPAPAAVTAPAKTAAAAARGAPLPGWEFPRIERTRLANGLRVSAVSRPGLGLLELRLIVTGGSGSDAQHPGIAALTGEWLKTGGTANRTSRELLEHVETMGAELSMATTFDATIISLSGVDSRFDEAVALLGSVTREPRFLASEFEKLKEREIERVASHAHGDAAWMATMALYAELFRKDVGVHPYARADARPADLAAIEPADARAWYAATFSPRNALLLASGDVKMDHLERAAEAAFGSWQGEEVPAPVFEAPAARRTLKISLVDNPGARFSELRIGVLGPERQSPRWPASSILTHILGGGPNARLALDVHRSPSFAHSASTFLVEVAHGPAPMVIAATIPLAKTGPALAACLERLRATADAAPTREEVEASTRELAGAALFGLETNEAAADLASRMSVLGLSDDYYDAYLEHLQRATTTEVHAAATEYSNRIQAAVVVGDAALLVTPLSHFGQVDVLDPENDFRIERIVTRDPTASIELAEPPKQNRPHGQ